MNEVEEIKMEKEAEKYLRNIAGFYHGNQANLIKEDFKSGYRVRDNEVNNLKAIISSQTETINELMKIQSNNIKSIDSLSSALRKIKKLNEGGFVENLDNINTIIDKTLK